MLNILKFDFYKTLKSKKIIIALIAGLLWYLFNALIMNRGNIRVSVVNMWLNQSFTVNMLIFSIVFCSSDFSSGYLKNVYSNTSKLKYVISKTIVLLAFSVATTLITFLFEILINCIFGPGVIFYTEKMFDAKNIGQADTANFSISAIFATIFTQILGLTTLGLVINLLCILINRFVVGVGAFLWWGAFSYTFYEFINDLLSKYIKDDYGIKKYTVLFNLDATKQFVFLKPAYSLLIPLFVYLTVLVVAFLLSWLAMCKKNF